MFRVLIAATALALSACASAPSPIASSAAAVVDDDEARRLLAGKWYGTYERAEDGAVSFLSERRPDGAYVVEFRKAQMPTTFEKGTWGVKDGVYWTVFDEWRFYGADEWLPADPSVRDEYRIVALSDSLFEYTHAEQGVQFKASRVTDDFQMPGKAESIEDFFRLPEF